MLCTRICNTFPCNCVDLTRTNSVAFSGNLEKLGRVLGKSRRICLVVNSSVARPPPTVISAIIFSAFCIYNRGSDGGLDFGVELILCVLPVKVSFPPWIFRCRKFAQEFVPSGKQQPVLCVFSTPSHFCCMILAPISVRPGRRSMSPIFSLKGRP